MTLGTPLPEIIRKAHAIQAVCEKRHSWEELIQIAVEQQLQKYDRDPALGSLYMNEFFPTIMGSYGSMEVFLRSRFGWTDDLKQIRMQQEDEKTMRDSENYFRPSMNPFDYRVIYNDWPYALPIGMSHFVVWSVVPLLPKHVVEGSLKNHLRELGVAGVSGSTLSTLDYIDGLYRSIGGTATTTANGSPQSTNLDIRISSDKDQDQDINDDPRKDIFSFVCQKWPEKDFETIFFINPAKVQTVPKLAHFHVLVRPKSDAVGNGSHALTIPENPTTPINHHKGDNRDNNANNICNAVTVDN